MKNGIEEMIPPEVKTVMILGHIRPDGDCVGSCLGLYHYLKSTRPELQVQICLQEFSDSFRFLSDIDKIQNMDSMDMNQQFDLCIACDSSDTARLGAAFALFEQARHTICIDHHATNTGFAQKNYIKGGLSSCAEALGQLFDAEKINKACAECLYLGIVHDTGVFKFSNTTCETMCFAGKLLEKGLNQTYIIDKTYYNRTVAQTLICGKAMNKMQIALEGQFVYTYISLEDMAEYGADRRDLDGIVDQLRIVEGAEVAAFIHETTEESNKVSLRSNNIVDVSKIAVAHGGGGHVPAAGFDSKLPYDELIEILIEEVSQQL